MFNNLPLRNAVLAVRVSTVGQGIDGDSPEAQIEQGQRYAPLHNMQIVKTLTYLESASGDNQPMQHVIDYALESEHKVDVVLIKSIDRLTRGGSTAYDLLKRQLDARDIALEDMYGVVSGIKVNTLEHLGMKYRWSEHTPSRKTELLEAERAKDEVRDILTRMIGSEIRYTQLGYWSRGGVYGLKTQKVETPNGKRTVLMEAPEAGVIIRKMFELRAEHVLNDDQIAQTMNDMGFKTPTKVVRDKTDRTKIVRVSGGKLMTGKLLRAYVRKTIYAGVNTEKWTGGNPVKCRFDGLVSIELFNAANHGKIVITPNPDDSNHPTVGKAPKLQKFAKKNVYNADFPYRKVVSCPTCHNSLLGSASRGRLGKHYPAYHCSNHGHYFRVPKPEFDATINSFIDDIVISPERLEQLMQAVLAVWEKRQGQVQRDEEFNAKRKEELETQIKLIVDKIKLISSETAIKYMEQDLMKIEQQLKELETKSYENTEETIDMPTILQYVKYFMEHIKELLIDHCNPIKKAHYFGVLFDEVATYDEIKNRSANVSQIPGVNELFKLAHSDPVSLVQHKERL
jgi:hypothetical protein